MLCLTSLLLSQNAMPEISESTPVPLLLSLLHAGNMALAITVLHCLQNMALYERATTGISATVLAEVCMHPTSMPACSAAGDQHLCIPSILLPHNQTGCVWSSTPHCSYSHE